MLLSDTAHVCQRFIKWAFSESEQFQVVRSARAEAPEIRKVVCVLEMGIGLCVEREGGGEIGQGTTEIKIEK